MSFDIRARVCCAWCLLCGMYRCIRVYYAFIFRNVYFISCSYYLAMGRWGKEEGGGGEGDDVCKLFEAVSFWVCMNFVCVCVDQQVVSCVFGKHPSMRVRCVKMFSSKE